VTDKEHHGLTSEPLPSLSKRRRSRQDCFRYSGTRPPLNSQFCTLYGSRRLVIECAMNSLAKLIAAIVALIASLALAWIAKDGVSVRHKGGEGNAILVYRMGT
jgi:hypothetical protein